VHDALAMTLHELEEVVRVPGNACITANACNRHVCPYVHVYARGARKHTARAKKNRSRHHQRVERTTSTHGGWY
jgi:hypothetical protein